MHGNKPTAANNWRAEQIAEILGDHKKWHSHGRMIGVKTLTGECRLQIEDYSKDLPLRKLIRSYNDLLIEYIGQKQYQSFMHNRFYF